MNTTNKPIELQNANEAVEVCWDRYDAAIEAGDSITAQALWVSLTILEDNQSSQYKQWQILGGTSDIESIALAGVGEYQPAAGRSMARTINFDGDGTYPNPFISGGEIRELTAWIDNSDGDEMPF